MDDIQKEFMKAVREGKNCCLTGGGGVGKTFTINKMREATKTKKIAMTAMTGLAAMHVEGTTIHSWSGMGGWNSLGHIVPIMRTHSWHETALRIKETDILIIDEISMMRSDQFNLLDLIMKKATKNMQEAFGGKQIIVVGDFLQLPPVVKSNEKIDSPWAFHSEAWKEGGFHVFHLTEIKRQSDQVFINALNDIRFGKCGLMTEATIRSREGSNEGSPIRLVSKNKQADLINNAELTKIDAQSYYLKGNLEYSSRLTSNENFSQEERELLEKYKKDIYKELMAQLNVSKTIWLKEGCRVLVMANNQEKGYVNGMMGTLEKISYMLDTTTQKYQEAQDFLELWGIDSFYETETHLTKDKNGDFKEIPLDSPMLTIPKWKEVSEGVRERLNGAVKWGDFNPSMTAKIKLDNGRYIYVEKKVYEIKDNAFSDEYEPMISFTQFPLRPAYAISIHKSQGMTLPTVEVECDGIFAEGQLYVALSRATTLEGLTLKNFSKGLVKANPHAVEFYNNL